MQKRIIGISGLAGALLVLPMCGSLIGETDRIRMLYAQKNPVTVIATDPADNSTAPYNQSYIDVTFSHTVETGTVTAQSTFGACTGSLQVSYDGFQNCLAGTVDGSGNPRIRFVPLVFPKGLGLQIKVTADVKSDIGIAVMPYVSAVGFKLGAPCGSENCFFSYTTPLMTNAGTATQIFAIRSGAHSGKYLILTSSSTTTTLLDPVAVTTSAGPTLPANCVPGDGGHNFYIATGATNKGKQAIVRGGNTSDWCLYDPAGHTITLSGTALPLTAGAGGLSLQPTSATSTEVDNTLALRGLSTNGILRYAPASELFTNVSAFYVVSGAIGAGAHALKLQTGINAGKWLIMNGAPAPSTTTWLFSESPAGFAVSTATAGALGGGAKSIEIGSGASGKVVTLLGGGTTDTSTLNTATFAAPTLQSGALPAAVSSAALLLRQSGTNSNDNPLKLHGGVAAAHTTSVYDTAAGTFSAGPISTGAILDGSAQIYIPGASGGAFFIVNGSTMPSTSVYFPHNNTFSATRTPGSIPNAGAHAVRISGGANDGRTLIVAAGLTKHTAVYDPLRHAIAAGVDTVNAIAASGFSVPLTRGSYAGNILTFVGGGSAVFNIYNAATNQYLTSVAAGLPTSGTVLAMNTGATAFPISGTEQIMIVRGNGTGTQIFSQSTGAIIAGNATSVTVNSVPLNLQFRTSVGVVKQAIYAQSNQLTIFDHGLLTFATATLTAAGGSGAQMFLIPSGAEAGNILFIHGGGSAATSIINRDTLTATAGPPVGGAGACGNTVVVNAGAQLLPIPYGANAGKALLLVGGDTPTTCMYDPATNAFSVGPVTSTTGSPGYAISNGALAFRTNGGIYPTSFVILSGANKNVWGTYVP